MVAACRDDLEPWALDDLESLRAPPRESSWPKKAKVIPDGVWITGDRELFTGKTLPSPSGHPFSGHIKPVGRLKEGPEGQYYFDPLKQLPTLRKSSWQAGDDALLLAQQGKVRRIQPIEVWRLKGGSTPAWLSALAEGHTPDELATWAVRTPSPGAAAVCAAWCVATLRNLPPTEQGERRAGVCPLPDEEEAWAALKGWLAARSVADGIRRVGGQEKRKGGPPDNTNAKQLARILVALLRHRLVELQGNTGGWASLQTLIAKVGSRRLTSKPPTLDEVRAAVVASDGRPTLQTTGEEEEYQIRSVQGHTGDTELASLGQALGCIEAWMLHATSLANLPSIWRQGLLPHGAPAQRGQAPRQDLYFRLGTDPRAMFPNPRTHPCNKLIDNRNVMIWTNWGPDDPSHAQNLMTSVTETGAILTRTPVPREHICLAVLFAPDTVAMVVVAASQQAHEARAEIIESFSHWGVLNWPDDPAVYWINDENPVDEPAVSPEIPDDVPGPGWPTLLTEADLHWSEGEGAPTEENRGRSELVPQNRFGPYGG